MNFYNYRSINPTTLLAIHSEVIAQPSTEFES